VPGATFRIGLGVSGFATLLYALAGGIGQSVVQPSVAKCQTRGSDRATRA